MTQEQAIARLLAVAAAEVGYCEKNGKAALDEPKTGAGSGNYTKYARDLDAIGGFYNGRKQGAAWCEVFVDWCFVQAFGAERGRRMLYQPRRSAGAGCASSARYYRRHGAFLDEPQAGDQVYFGQSACTHTGLVERVTKDAICTVEGNSGNAVRRCRYARGDGRIRGYGRPDWALAGEVEA